MADRVEDKVGVRDADDDDGGAAVADEDDGDEDDGDEDEDEERDDDDDADDDDGESEYEKLRRERMAANQVIVCFETRVLSMGELSLEDPFTAPHQPPLFVGPMFQAFLAKLGFNENERTLQNPMRVRAKVYKKRLERRALEPARRSSRNEGKAHKTYDVDALFREMTREEREREQKEVSIGFSLLRLMSAKGFKN